jgi:glycosyltransferase involved in cell wall biosynthesis
MTSSPFRRLHGLFKRPTSDKSNVKSTKSSTPNKPLAAAPNSETIVQLLGSMGLNRGGLTRAVYERSLLLGSARQLVLAPLAFQLNYDVIVEQLLQEGRIPSSTLVETFHDWANRQCHTTGNPEADSILWKYRNQGESISAVTETTGNGKYRRYFHHGRFIAMIYTNHSGQISYAEHQNPTEPWKTDFRDTYDTSGRIRRREYYNERRQVRYITYFNELGGAYLSHWRTENGYDYRATHFLDSKTKQYKDLRALHKKWIKDLVNRLGRVVLFSDEPTTAFAIRLKLNNSRAIGAIHTTHYANKRDIAEGQKGWVTHYTNISGALSKLVFFTPTQAADFTRDNAIPRGIATVIPHAAPSLEQSTSIRRITKRDPKRVVVISRLDKDKQIDHAIKAFDIAWREDSAIQLDIYGTGPEEESLAKLVESLDSKSSITFHGFTEKPLHAFASAAVFLMTSHYEGFGLVITESFSVGTPVVSYDVPYGPHDLIKNGLNGFKVSEGDLNGLARNLLAVTSSSQTDLTAGALRTAETYSHEVWAENWNQLVNSEFTELANRPLS